MLYRLKKSSGLATIATGTDAEPGIISGENSSEMSHSQDNFSSFLEIFLLRYEYTKEIFLKHFH